MDTNATYRLLAPMRKTSSTDVLQRESETRDVGGPDRRCRLRALSASAAITALGKVSLQGYTCRLQTEYQIQPGWQLQITSDGEDTRHTYTVAQVRKSHHVTLTLEKVE